jgi:hypothetical protein
MFTVSVGVPGLIRTFTDTVPPGVTVLELAEVYSWPPAALATLMSQVTPLTATTAITVNMERGLRHLFISLVFLFLIS